MTTTSTSPASMAHLPELSLDAIRATAQALSPRHPAWSVGTKDMACFDGERWTRFDVPGNPAIR